MRLAVGKTSWRSTTAGLALAPTKYPTTNSVPVTQVTFGEYFTARGHTSAYIERRTGGNAEEVAQDMFLTFIAKIDPFRQVSSLASWIHRIAVTAALMRKRRHNNADLSTRRSRPARAAPGKTSGRLVCRARRTAPCAAKPGR